VVLQRRLVRCHAQRARSSSNNSGSSSHDGKAPPHGFGTSITAVAVQPAHSFHIARHHL
jgi:hypothetical protein